MPRFRTYTRKRKQGSSAMLEVTPATHSFQPRAFAVQAKEKLTADSEQQENSQESEATSLESSLSKAERFGHHLSRVSVYSTNSPGPAMVQRKRLKKGQAPAMIMQPPQLQMNEASIEAEEEEDQSVEQGMEHLSALDSLSKPGLGENTDRPVVSSSEPKLLQRSVAPVIQRNRNRSNAISLPSTTRDRSNAISLPSATRDRSNAISLPSATRDRSNAISEAENVPTTRGRNDAVSDPTQQRGHSDAFSVQVAPLSQLNYKDFDGKQYRVSGSPPNRMIEEVKRAEVNGKVTYFATGLVTNFSGNKPFVAPYPQPQNLGDWYPSVTHLNGMNVNPSEGLTSAEALHESVNQALNGGMAPQGLALGQDAIDVLYTYSAQRGNGVSGLVFDLWDCLKGKVRVNDQVTARQETIMLDAVRAKKRTAISAHSRGTIKTDNAVRNVFKQLVLEYAPEAFSTPLVQAAYETGGEKAANKKAKEIAAQRAKIEMDNFIQLIYAGNAVIFPSSTIPAEMFVGGGDLVSMFVGSYSTFRAGNVGGDNTLHRVKGTHGFDANYAASVGNTIAQDIKNQSVRPNMSGGNMTRWNRRNAVSSGANRERSNAVSDGVDPSVTRERSNAISDELDQPSNMTRRRR